MPEDGNIYDIDNKTDLRNVALMIMKWKRAHPVLPDSRNSGMSSSGRKTSYRIKTRMLCKISAE
ncbi:hypothetical protein FHS09_003349 [Microbulbifer rhizosphaerae]|uniref:Uncharacterized protein n=1 Tax=Microbulbifer rhizosphaerae TaxID=1562603 RepID=A0A7W4ZBP0_9GAMM|nr:hypothetical protein [Microbulbifer rhizosphaerae]